MGLTLYFIGCSLAGLGFTLLATVPGTYLLTRTFRHPDFAFGLYFTVGGLGGVAGPPLYLLTQSLSGRLARFLDRLRALSWRRHLWQRCLVDTKTDLARAAPKPTRSPAKAGARGRR